MPDALPPTTDSPALAALTPAPLARLDVDLKALRMERLMAAEQQYDLHHLDADSADVLPDCQYINYLPGPGGQL